MTGNLDKAAIVAAARRMIERDGADALSMRKLARELDSRPMTLYYYVPSKDDLLLAVLTAVADEISWTQAAPGASPRDAMVQIVVDMAERLGRIDWIIDILRAGTHVGPPALILADRFISAAYAAGASAQQALDTWRSCWYLVSSELQWQRGLRARSAAEQSWFERIDPAVLDNVPIVQSLLSEWPALSAGFDLKQAITRQIDGALAQLSRGE